jgi:hypothetical protein
MTKVPFTSPELLRQLLDYDTHTGLFAWAQPTRDWFASDAHWSAFKKQQAGDTPFAAAHSAGYLWGEIGGEQLLAHRVVWAYCHNAWPDEHIDHINHDREDNRIANLRVAPQSENAKNAGMRSDNTSGVTGVYWVKSRKKWAAQIGLPGGVTKPLGRYSSLDDAVAARKAAEKTYGFHPNHGRDLRREDEK